LAALSIGQPMMSSDIYPQRPRRLENAL
jgi:hypothetical protein